jgi:D-alanyl-D-alanine carboxypeptidase
VLLRSRDQGDWSATFGTREIGKDVPLSMDDYFRVGSNTKTMTSTVILQLVQEGKLKLDDPVSAHWPTVPNGDTITIAQLSEMRSGLYSYTFDRAFNETLDREPQKEWAPEELLAIGFSHPPNFEPGERFEYCNTNTVLLGVIIEQLTGMPASEAFRKRIFEPLGLRHTSLPHRTDSSIPDPHPQGYAFGTNVSTIDTFALPPPEHEAAVAGTLPPNDETNANPSWAWTAGGAISTVGDLAIYAKALVGGGLLDEKTQKIRLDSIQPTDPANPGAAGYGLNLARFGPYVMGHDGQLPGFMTFMGYDPQAENTIIVATNLATVPAGEGSALVLAKAILGTLYGASSVPKGSPAEAPPTNA